MREQRPGKTMIVATAYMEEAERFEQVIAMNAGAILARGTPAEIKSQVGCALLENSFIALLPAAMRSGHQALRIPPRTAIMVEPAIVAHDLTRRFGDFTAVIVSASSSNAARSSASSARTAAASQRR
jgi:ribosome-dependent ATPase